MNAKDFLSFEKEKATAFNIFTALLCRPSEELNQDSSVFEKLNSSLQIISPECAEKTKAMGVNIIKYTQLELLVEYTRLFIGPFSILAQPYSCMYFGGKSLMSEETLWVINFYEKMGLVYDHNLKDAPDHIAIETEFLYYLAFNCITEYETGNIANAHKFWNGQMEFFQGHYKSWIPKFCKNIIDNSENDFYKAFADCFSTFVNTITIEEFPEVLDSTKVESLK